MSRATLQQQMLGELRKISAKIDSLRQADAVSISVHETARRLSCSTSRVYELLKRGALQTAPSFGRGMMVLAVSVESLAREGLPAEEGLSRGKKREFKIDPKNIKV